MSHIRTGLVLRPAVIVPLLCLIYALVVVNRYDTPLALVTLGDQFAPDGLATYTEEGYDGQFVYYFARYGVDAEPYVDLPAYRGQRALLPVLGRILSFDQADWIPYILLTINLLALAGGTWMLEILLEDQRVSRWFAIGYALSAGVFGATRLMTTEPLAYGFVLAAIVAIQRDHWRVGAIAFALAVLSKETTLFFPAAYGIYWLYQRKIAQAITLGAIVLIPFALLQVGLYRAFGEFGIGSGGGGATSFEWIPFAGVFRIIWVSLTNGGVSALIAFMLLVGTFVLLPTIWAFWQCWDDFRYTQAVKRGDQPASTVRGWDLRSTVLLASVAIMPFVPFSTYREPLGILRFIVGLQIALIWYAATRRKRRALMYSTLWFVSSILVIVSDFAPLAA